ncbi:hypothetical protein ACFP81_03280 [Deinococcus lacus]|uniref:DoxX family membrane protein n=1 Tax=Deinococcus lacus TaxID=392561 RepID=A0ABW1YCA8_9DEIO
MTLNPSTHPIQTAARWLLGAALLAAGTGHLTFAQHEFRAQVPDALTNGPLYLDEDFIVLASGAAELGLGAALIGLPRQRRTVGLAAAGFFVAVFPGNISQYLTHTDAFGLNSDRARLIRLAFQPALVAWALWSTGVWPRARR